MRILHLFLAGLLALPALPAAAQPIPSFLDPILANGRPHTAAQVLLLVRGLAESGACARGEFYSVPVMHALFGKSSDAKADEDEILFIVSAHGLEELVIADDESTRQSPYLKGVWLDARRPKTGYRWDAACFMTVMFWGEMEGLDYPSVKAVLGEGERDKRAEMGRDVQASAHPWGKPALPKNDLMSDAIIRYRVGAGSLTLNFDFHGKLHDMFVSWPNDVTVPNTSQ